MYKRTEFKELLLALALLAFAAFWARVFLLEPRRSRAENGGSVAVVSTADGKIAQDIIGFWIVPLTEHWDPQNANLRTVEEFQVGGKGSIYLYDDSQCRRVIQSFPFTWNIRRSFLEYQVQGGQKLRDRIARLDSNSLILLPDDGGQTSRIRGTSCARSESF